MNKITRDHLRGYRRVTVMGLGLFGGGAGAARYFATLGARVVVTDTAVAKKLAKSVASLNGLGIEFVLGRHRREDFTDTDLVIANQAIRPENIFLTEARNAGIPIFTETGLALALNRSPWAGVTGSAGKSTTSALIAAMIQAHDPDAVFGGNIGGDLITRVEERPESSPLVIELSSFQLTYLAQDFAIGRIRPPKAAVITNLAPNHLDWHKDMDEYLRVKLNLAQVQGTGDWTILNFDDPILRQAAGGFSSRVVACAMTDPGVPDAGFSEERQIVLRLDGERVLELGLEAFRLLGRHNAQNAIQAAAAAFIMCRDADSARKGLEDFSGLPHRLERIRPVRGRWFVNDSKSTTPEASIIALDALEMHKVLIAGGYDKHSPFEKLGAAIQEKAAGLVLVGPAGRRLGEAVRAAAAWRPAAMGELPIIEAGNDFPAAVKAAFELTPEGGAVLLSPACASFDMFVNYQERGEQFRELATILQ